MRIAVLNSVSTRLGGVETYLNTIVPALAERGHDIAFGCESAPSPAAAPIALPLGAPLWVLRELGLQAMVESLRAWRPDLIYAHGLVDSALEEAILDCAPIVRFAHGYIGTCISGYKRWAMPHLRPCARRFGWPCLLHFYPHRCGGLSPLTMLRQFSDETSHLRRLRRVRALLVASEHMRREYLAHGFDPRVVHLVPLPIQGPDRLGPLPRLSPSAVRLLFVGRLTILKGCDFLLRALPAIYEGLGRRIELTIVGDGPQRSRLESLGRALVRYSAWLGLEFLGELDSPALDQRFDRSDLLVVPSLWPEPFGMVGPEAGLHGLPAVGFALGGIPEWLGDGVGGYLAAADPPDPARLAQAVIRALRDPEQHARLRRGAFEQSRRFGLEAHMHALIPILAAAGSSD